MAAWKYPGSDEFPKGFYQNTLNHIGENLCTFIHQLWSKYIPLKFVNLIDICLIPKIDSPQQVSHFRPITLCNTSYNVFTKVIFNRCKKHMDTIVSRNQSSFIPKISSHDNIVITREILHSMNRSKRKVGSFTIKIDLTKEYDNMKCKFIINVISKVGISINLKELIILVVQRSIFDFFGKVIAVNFLGQKRLKTRWSIVPLFVCHVHGQTFSSNSWRRGEQWVELFEDWKRWT